MIATSPVSREHHARLTPHLADLAATGDLVGTATGAELRARLDVALEFLNGLLLPHLDAAERAFYPELERLLQNVHSMTPMRHEHAEIRALVADLGRRRATLGDGPVGAGASVAIRRDLFRLFDLLKVHLAEEQLYANLVERGLTPEGTAALAAAMEHDGILHR